MNKFPNEAEAVIKAFGGLAKTARALGHKHMTTVQGWKDSGRIPSWRRLEITAAAEREKVDLPPDFSVPVGTSANGNGAVAKRSA